MWFNSTRSNLYLQELWQCYLIWACPNTLTCTRMRTHTHTHTRMPISFSLWAHSLVLLLLLLLPFYLRWFECLSLSTDYRYRYCWACVYFYLVCRCFSWFYYCAFCDTTNPTADTWTSTTTALFFYASSWRQPRPTAVRLSRSCECERRHDRNTTSPA